MSNFLTLHRPDGVKVIVAIEHIVSVAPAEQSHNISGHRATVYLVTGQFREVRESLDDIEALISK